MKEITEFRGTDNNGNLLFSASKVRHVQFIERTYWIGTHYTMAGLVVFESIDAAITTLVQYTEIPYCIETNNNKLVYPERLKIERLTDLIIQKLKD